MTQNIYAVNHDQCVDILMAQHSLGLRQTVQIEGDTGSGKTSIHHMLAAALPDHIPCYFDSTTKTVGDSQMPKVLTTGGGEHYLTFVPNEEFGIHMNKPVILMIDEIGKAPNSVKNNLLRVMQEWEICGKPLPEGSIVFCTTNLSDEGLGDNFLPHQMDRVTVVRMRKPTTDEWVANYAVPKGLNFAVTSWVQETPQLGQTFTEIKDPEDNPYIYHPRATNRRKFVTYRGLEKASRWLDASDAGLIDDTTLNAALIGTLGERGGRDLVAYNKLCRDLPTLDQIKNDPLNAPVPVSASTLLMVVYRTTATVDYSWVDAWMQYMLRLPETAQSTFVNRMRTLQERKAKANEKDERVQAVYTCNRFKQWCLDNKFLFSVDK